MNITQKLKLTQQQVRYAKPECRADGTLKQTRLQDGNGLMLDVKPSGSKSWVQRLVIQGKRRDFGLGGYPQI